MKKLIYSFAAFIIGLNIVNAKQVESSVAKQVAENFIRQNAKMKALNLALSHTEKSAAGKPDYYVFDINNNTGFIIVSAEDAGRPVIGYSTESRYQIPSATSNPNFNFWMQKRKEEIEYMRDHNLQANAEIATEWTNYATNKVNPSQTMSIPYGPLCATKWDQEGGGSGANAYNAQCPGGSLTGCVATTMAQIMKKWNYPTRGTGSHSYTTGSYGTLSANFGAATYNWAGMPDNSSSAAVATLMYHCGVSVEMKYSPGGSSAQVCFGFGPSAQESFYIYFGYDLGMHCEQQTDYTTAVWNGMLVAEFAAGRPVQYQGFRAGGGGHSWVCDGNDANDNMHMNWGWSGGSNGYYAVTNLAPTGTSYNYTQNLSGILGIQPKTGAGVDESINSYGFSIYPNPSDGEFTIYNLQSTIYDLKIYNIMGEKVYSDEIVQLAPMHIVGRTSYIVHSDLPAGVYFIQTKTDPETSPPCAGQGSGGIATQKLIIQQ